jgi:hypothetical protein
MLKIRKLVNYFLIHLIPCTLMISNVHFIADAKYQQQKDLLKELKNWEDVKESNAYFTKLKVTEILCCFLTIVHLVNSIVIYELDYKGYEVEMQLYISTFSIFYLIIMLNIRYLIQFKWMI